MSIFNCLNPIYTLNPIQKKTCPNTLGLISGSIVFIICLFLGYSIHTEDVKKFERNTVDANGNKPKKPNLGSTMFGAFICGLIMSVLVYFGTKFFFKIRVTQNDSIIQNYMDTYKMSEQEAINQLSRLRQQKELASAFRQGSIR